MSNNVFSILELMLNHEIQLHDAIKKKEWKIASKIIYAMIELIPKEFDKMRHEECYNICDCTNHAYHDNCEKCGCSPL